MKKKGQAIPRYIVIGIFFATLFCFSIATAADDYPSQPVRIICPLSPGGAVDTTMRALTSVAEKYLGQPLVAENKTGGGGTVGAAYVASSKPDGYTILISSSTSLLVKPIQQKLPYTAEDFVAIGQILAPLQLIYVRTSSPWKTLNEFIEDAKKNVGKLRYASPGGKYSMEHIVFSSLEKKSGIKLVHIPAGGGAPALALALGGHVEVGSSPLLLLKPHFDAKTIRPIAVWGSERIDEFKEVPTLAELGFDIPAFYWIAVLAPKDTPKPIVKKLSEMLKKSVEDKAFIPIITRLGDKIRYLGGEDFEKKFKNQRANITDILKEMQ